MTTIGYHASHEQLSPADLLRHVQHAERAGFDAAMCSDHFAPWSEAQGESGFAWSWLGAAMAQTNLPFGVVNAPGDRYHPAIIAQAAATLDQMFPDRFWVALGTGQALNEHITGRHWPPKPERNARLRECVDIMRALWAGETVTHHGLVTVEEARLWTLPASPPRIYGAAISEETARWVGSWADGLITINQTHEHLQRVITAFRDGGGDGKPMSLQVHLSYAATDEEALAAAHDQWRATLLPAIAGEHLRSPAQFDAVARFVRPEDVRGHVRVSPDPAEHADWLREYLALGFDALYLHQVGRDQERFIDTFAEKVLPALGRQN